VKVHPQKTVASGLPMRYRSATCLSDPHIVLDFWRSNILGKEEISTRKRWKLG
jgi:hypothetical protein